LDRPHNAGGQLVAFLFVAAELLMALDVPRRERIGSGFSSTIATTSRRSTT
jgi:hypothetical protein